MTDSAAVQRKARIASGDTERLYTYRKKVKAMKNSIHPNYKPTTITCACGEVIQTSSTKENIKIEICSKCHPFFTGKQKLVDTGGRVDRFNKRFGITK